VSKPTNRRYLENLPGTGGLVFGESQNEESMLRKILLVIIATACSFVLTALSGYILYRISDGKSEMHLSLMIRFIFDPMIAMLIGVLVGSFSKDHPALTSIIGLVPWVLMLHGSRSGRSLGENFAWLIPILVYLVLAAGCALMVWRFRYARKVSKNAGGNIGMSYL